MARLNEIRTRLRGTPERVRVAMKLAKTSGMLWAMNVGGVRELVRTMVATAQNPAQIYRIHSKNSPDKPALIWHDEVLTFAELDRRIDQLAGALAARGVVRGSSIALMMRNRTEYIQLGAAAARIGAAAVAVSWRSTPKELEYLVNHCGAILLAHEAELSPTVAEARAALPKVRAYLSVGGEARGATPFEALLAEKAPDFVPETGSEEDAAVVVYTSGTTGKPKGAVRKFPRESMNGFLRFLSETPLRVDDTHLVACPLYHSTAFGFLSFTHILGGAVVIMDEFKPRPFLELVARHQVTTTAVVPTMLHRLMELGHAEIARHDTRSLRAIFVGGAPLPGPLGTEVMDVLGDVLFNFYGATETGIVTLAKPADLRASPWTIGRAVPGNDIRLLNDEGTVVPDGVVGELYVKNDFLMTGYHKDEGATSESMRDGYFSVGDLARRDRDGRYFIEGRKRDMVISGGVNVYPAEVEGVLEQHPELAEVAVVGVPDPEWGERVRAFVVRKRGSALDDGALKAWTRERLAGPKVPRDFVFLEHLPRNPTGKVLKRELRNHAP